ncbi:DUF4407 domain-containing protein [Pedobacter sp. JY14-1]|uniref:DUF4407 domain-containing protein n=1 Tax=Pedobacter sp. JY14-1 TaxID=3034151 RepID=UPI0023E0B5F5|nr:DUF4407 domain-containing protein [Pedobacter sp. JY14-1]
MKNWWLKVGCFLTGYNYEIVIRSSEVAAIRVKQTISALVIVCIIWAFVGYVFTQRYLEGTAMASTLGSLLACTIVIQIERQIILSIDPGKLLFAMRILIAVLMAIIGSVIVDQIIFKADIEKRKISLLDQEINKVFPLKSQELRLQINSLDSTISAKEMQRSQLDMEISRSPTINNYSNKSEPVIVPIETKDSLGNIVKKTKIVNTRSTSVTSVPNPKIDQVKPLDALIASLRESKAQKDNNLLMLRSSLEEDFKSKVGFLDELKIMFNILFESPIALGVWIIWFLILFGLELFILASKMGEKVNIYDETLMHQEKLQRRKLELMSNT